jgi:DNA-binding response OmpR family regulator
MANILVVDDEMGIRELLSEILSDEGHAIQLAENAQQAREARAQGAPDLVLLDIWMPDTDGVTLLKEWQRDGLLTMPVIMMSGHATIDTAVEATRIGALNFLEKPIALQKLLKAVQAGLTRAQETVRAPALAPRPVAAAQPEETVAGLRPAGGLGADRGARRRHRGRCRQSHVQPVVRPAAARGARRVRAHVLRTPPGPRRRQHDPRGGEDRLERTHLYRKLKQLGVEPGKLAKKGA